MDSTWEEIRKKAKEQTDDTFASKVSSLTRLTDDEIKEIIPNALDKERLATLLGIVADATKSNNEKAEAIRNINGLAEIAIPLLLKLL
ncbi:MAG: hypothetical protein A2277_08195 [Desulfobacterales bacterium RIFOXYA12_FULL_46_15]|nr:MAG: hypothetical protein A2277_08195 [Desulfobacterales bacterium RIFOXYA12_FULL_46_15]